MLKLPTEKATHEENQCGESAWVPDNVVSLFKEKASLSGFESEIVSDQGPIESLSDKINVNRDALDLCRRLQHEINNPLSVIIGAASLLEMKLADCNEDGQNDELLQFAKLILNSSKVLKEKMAAFETSGNN